MSSETRAEEVVEQMLKKDAFSRWLGITVEELAPGFAKISMKVREEMVNGFDVCHGGVTYAFADSAFAFAANSHGRVSVALDVSISYPAPVRAGDMLTATAREQSLGNRTGMYDVTVTNQNDEKVGLFRGTVYRLSLIHI